MGLLTIIAFWQFLKAPVVRRPLITWLHAKKIGKEVLLYIFKIVFSASLFEGKRLPGFNLHKCRVKNVSSCKYSGKVLANCKWKILSNIVWWSMRLSSYFLACCLLLFSIAFAWKASHGHVASLLEGHWLTNHLTEQTRTNMSAKSATGLE